MWRSEYFILGIDPGNEDTAFCLVDSQLRPVRFAKLGNELAYCEMVDAIAHHALSDKIYVACEMIASYGMPVGKEVFDTCVWIGQLKERLAPVYDFQYIYRKEEKMTICHSMKASDANITQALVDRFAPGVPNHGKGNKKAPGWFYGFRADIWQAYAVAVTYHDIYKGEDNARTSRY